MCCRAGTEQQKVKRVKDFNSTPGRTERRANNQTILCKAKSLSPASNNLMNKISESK